VVCNLTVKAAGKSVRAVGDGRTIRVTDDIVAATQRAISAVAVIPSWIRSISGEGQSPPQPAKWAAGREVRSCTRVSMTRRSSGSSSSPAYCDHVNHIPAWNGRDGFSGGGWRRVTNLAEHRDVRG
jgi:hypothetical protein